MVDLKKWKTPSTWGEHVMPVHVIITTEKYSSNGYRKLRFGRKLAKVANGLPRHDAVHPRMVFDSCTHHERRLFVLTRVDPGLADYN